uniref:glutathione transferase n=1 Tax=Plectus sambesii TaxID=2011161 RepID=A0A914XTW4_9BILA
MRGRGETARLIFAQAGVDYTDHRFGSEEWKEIKGDMPFGQVPVLEVDGTEIAQSTAIGRYLANEFGLAGKNKLEAARADMFVEVIEEARSKYIPWVHVLIGWKQGDKDELFNQIVEAAYKTPAAVFEKYLKQNGTGWIVGDSLTWADLVAAEYFDKGMVYGRPDVLDGFPFVKALTIRVFELPNIKKYLATRPPALF